MKQIRWIGEERFLPAIGTVRKGSLVDAPDDKAASFINQGLAEIKKAKRTTTTSEEST